MCRSVCCCVKRRGKVGWRKEGRFSRGAPWKGPGSIERPCRKLTSLWAFIPPSMRGREVTTYIRHYQTPEPRVSWDQVHERYIKANPAVITGSLCEWPNVNLFEDHPRDILGRQCLESNQTHKIQPIPPSVTFSKSSFKAHYSKLERLFSLKRGKETLKLELWAWNSIRNLMMSAQVGQTESTMK